MPFGRVVESRAFAPLTGLPFSSKTRKSMRPRSSSFFGARPMLRNALFAGLPEGLFAELPDGLFAGLLEGLFGDLADASLGELPGGLFRLPFDGLLEGLPDGLPDGLLDG